MWPWLCLKLLYKKWTEEMVEITYIEKYVKDMHEKKTVLFHFFSWHDKSKRSMYDL
jgi:hypothetical protein